MWTKKRCESGTSSSYKASSKASSSDAKAGPGNKRGQVTVFIIIGIIILFTFAGVLYFTKTVIKEEITAEGDPVIADVPQEFQPLKAYTDNCLQQIGERGLLVLGEQSGYIYPDLLGEYSVSAPTDSDGLNLEPLKVPYWHYNKLKNSEGEIEYTSLQPELYADNDPEMSVEAQLSRFAEEKLDGCLNDYAAFANQVFEVNYAEGQGKETIVTVGENTVNFWLKMQFTAKKGGAEYEFTQFYVKLPVKLKQIYETASEIAGVEYNHNFLERQALDLISTYSGVSRDKLPPTEDLTFDAIPTVYWNEMEVQEKVQEMLTSNVPLMRYYGSDNFYRYEYPANNEAVLDLSGLYQKNYDNMILPLELGQGLNINFDYFNWPIYFDVNDQGGTVKPSNYAANFYKLNFATQHYYTTYDLSYPVLATLEDPDAFNGLGYKFSFALESNVRNNAVVKTGYIEPEPVASAVKSMVCDEDKRSTELIRTVVLDSASREPLEAVQVGFSIPEQDNCLLGMTDAQGEFESPYPAVYGGVGSYMKEGYLTDFYPINTYDYQEQPGIIGYAVAGFPERVIEMHPYHTIKVKLKLKNLEKCLDDFCFSQGLFSGGEEIYAYTPQMLETKHRWVFPNVATRLGEDETATVILNRVSGLQQRVFNDEYVAFATINGDAVINGDTSSEMELVPGVYKVTIMVASSKDLIIPKEERCTGGVLEAVACWDTEGCCFTYEQTVLKEMITGQVNWDAQEYYLTITPEQLYSAKEMTIYALGLNLEGAPQANRVIEDMEAMSKLGQFSQQLRTELEPSYG